MRRALSVWLPTFATDLEIRRLLAHAPRATRPPIVLLTKPVASREQVVHRCAQAARLGVQLGMDLAHARTLLPSGAMLHTAAHRHERDLASLRALARLALRFSPLVAPDPPDGLVIDTTGTERVHKGERALVRALSRFLRARGHACRMCIAPSFACAWALARCSPAPLSRVEQGRQREALSPLPIAALRLDQREVEALAQVNVRTIGDLLALPRAAVAARFSAQVLARLDLALAREPERIEPVRSPPVLRAGLKFDGATDHYESLEVAARKVLHELVGHLARAQRSVRRLQVEILRDHAPPECCAITLSRASRSAKHLWNLLEQRVRTVDLSVPVAGMVLTATRTAHIADEQVTSVALGASDQPTKAAAFAEFVDTLAARLGPDAVQRAEPIESHLPERSWRAVSAVEGCTKRSDAITTEDRPTRLFEAPQSVRVLALTPDGPVLKMTDNARSWSVLRCSPPERISPEWWRGPPVCAGAGEREYFRVQRADGVWLWVCRQHIADGSSRWNVHGVWA